MPAGQGDEPARQAVERLERDFRRLKEDWDAEHRGVEGWLRKWSPGIALVASLLAGLFAVPPGLKAIFDYVRESSESKQFQPNTRIVGDEAPTLELRYLPKERRLAIAVDLTLHNEGKSEDMVAPVGARLDAPGLTKDYVPFASDAVACESDGAVLPPRFPVPGASSRYLRCQFEATLGDIGKATLEGGGSRRLCAQFRTRSDLGSGGRILTVGSCFFLPDDMARVILSSSQKEEIRRFRKATCSQDLLCR